MYTDIFWINKFTFFMQDHSQKVCVLYMISMFLIKNLFIIFFLNVKVFFVTERPKY